MKIDLKIYTISIYKIRCQPILSLTLTHFLFRISNMMPQKFLKMVLNPFKLKIKNLIALILRSPLMLTWGISDYEGNEKYELSLQFPSEEYRSEKVQATLDNLIALENKFKEDVMANSRLGLEKKLRILMFLMLYGLLC